MRLVIFTAGLILFSVLSQPTLAQGSVALDQKAAVEMARSFVAASGYTGESTKRRAIEPEPVFAALQNENGAEFWSVLFYFKDHDNDEDLMDSSGSSYHLGREVRIDPTSRKIWLAKKPVRLPVSLLGDCLGESDGP